jgi:Uma2 family endonuclease
MSPIAPTQRSTFPPPAPYRFTVDEYERLVAAGVLDEPRVELIDGFLVKKMGKNPPHTWSVDRVLELVKPLAPGWWCRKEEPVRIADFHEPEPDIALARGTRDDYRFRIPEPIDIALVIEVAETTLDRDQGKKWKAYAHARIPVYWIVNLVHRQVEVYTNPGQDGYGNCQIFVAGQDVPLVIDGKIVGVIAVAGILP